MPQDVIANRVRGRANKRISRAGSKYKCALDLGGSESAPWGEREVVTAQRSRRQ